MLTEGASEGYGWAVMDTLHALLRAWEDDDG